MPVSWSLLTPVAVSAASLVATVDSDAIRMHCRWLLSQVESRLLDLSFGNDDASVMQAAVILSAGCNAGMRMLRSQAVLSASLVERTDTTPAEATVRLLKAVAMSGTHDDELFRGLVRRVSRLLSELSLPQLADVAFALSISTRHSEHLLTDLCFARAAKLLHDLAVQDETAHPYCLFQLYLVHVVASSSGRGDGLRARMDASLPTAAARSVLNTIRQGAEQAQLGVSRGSRSSGSWHLSPAAWRGEVSEALLAVAGADFTRVRLDVGLKNRFKWSHLFTNMDFAVHCAPSSAYMFGPVSPISAGADSLDLPTECELQHTLRPSFQAMLDATCSGGGAVQTISFASWAEALSPLSRERLVREALAKAAESQVRT